MNTTLVELKQPTEAGRTFEGKLTEQARGKFGDVLGEVRSKTEDSEEHGKQRGPRTEKGKQQAGRPQSEKRGKHPGRPSEEKAKGTKGAKDNLASLVDAVAAQLNDALAAMTSGRTKPDDKQHVEQAFAQRSRAAKPLHAVVLPKLAGKKGAREDGEAVKGAQQAAPAESPELPEVQRVLAPREAAPILTTRSTPMEVRLAATVQNVRPAAAVAPTNQYVQIRPSNDGGAAQIRLDLGNGTHLDVSLDVRDGVARVHLRSNGADVTSKMAQGAGELVKALLDAGVDAAEVDIEWDDPDHESEQQKQQGQDQERDADEDSDGETFTSFVHIVT